MEKLITYVGLDVHKETISVAVADGGDRGQARYFGKIANNTDALSKSARKLLRKGRGLRFCYEAGPCGYGIHRHLIGLGHDCAVVAPSLIPRRPGDRVKRSSASRWRANAAATAFGWCAGSGHKASKPMSFMRLALPSRASTAAPRPTGSIPNC